MIETERVDDCLRPFGAGVRSEFEYVRSANARCPLIGCSIEISRTIKNNGVGDQSISCCEVVDDLLAPATSRIWLQLEYGAVSVRTACRGYSVKIPRPVTNHASLRVVSRRIGNKTVKNLFCCRRRNYGRACQEYNYGKSIEAEKPLREFHRNL